MTVGSKVLSVSASGDAEEGPVVSPCVSICALDGDEICTGCHRSGEEIRQWILLDNTERRAVLNKARERSKVGNPFV
ncbi:hypothetical protein A9Q90_06225 [Gammaproteobacteria bacterium 54_18_T64]|nr:hypothetical protein A9Q90_06225 [Gammaproteobacteria bacterium 54_18_T64]